MHEKLLTVPHIVAVFSTIGVLDSSWVTTSNEVSDAASNTGAGVPKDFGGTTVVHGAGPDGENDVFAGKSSVVNKSLMLVDTRSKGDIVVLAPSTEGVKEKDWVLVALVDEVNTGLLEEENVSVVEGVAYLEAVDGVGTTGLDLFVDFVGSVSVLVHAVAELDTGGEVHARSGNEPVALRVDGIGLRVFEAEATESTSADFFLSVFEEDCVVDNSKNCVADGAALNGYFLLASEGYLLLVSDVLSDRH